MGEDDRAQKKKEDRGRMDESGGKATEKQNESRKREGERRKITDKQWVSEETPTVQVRRLAAKRDKLTCKWQSCSKHGQRRGPRTQTCQSWALS